VLVEETDLIFFKTQPELYAWLDDKYEPCGPLTHPRAKAGSKHLTRYWIIGDLQTTGSSDWGKVADVRGHHVQVYVEAGPPEEVILTQLSLRDAMKHGPVFLFISEQQMWAFMEWLDALHPAA
jgi:hypothetical protein